MNRFLFWKRKKKKPKKILGFEIGSEDKKKEAPPHDSEAFLAALKASNFHGFVEYLSSPWRIFFSNFLGGIARGLGIVLGMTVVLAFLIGALNWFVDFPLIGEYFLDIKEMLEAFVEEGSREKR